MSLHIKHNLRKQETIYRSNVKFERKFDKRYRILINNMIILVMSDIIYQVGIELIFLNC